MCNLHWCYTFCTGVTLFALVLHLNCTALSQSELSNFFMCIIRSEIILVISSAQREFDLKSKVEFSVILNERHLLQRDFKTTKVK